jgi:tRNA threonylcarbamoyladenosine biosynthesis protein TsaB
MSGRDDNSLIMALDTSHLKGSVSITDDDDVLCEIVFDAADTHSATLMPAVDRCLRFVGIGVEEIDLFAVVVGPGSFTGLRIGLATVKALASVRKRPVVPLTALRVLAAVLPYARGCVMPLIDARRGEVYGAIYDTSEGLPVEMVSPFADKPEKIGKIIEDAGIDGPVVFCGTGFFRYREVLKKNVPVEFFGCGSHWSIPRSSVLSFLSPVVEAVPYNELPILKPLYIRPPDARLPSGTKLKR